MNLSKADFKQKNKEMYLKLLDYYFEWCSRCCLEGWKSFASETEQWLLKTFFMHCIHNQNSTKTCTNRKINVMNHQNM